MAATEATVGTSAGASDKTPVVTAASSCDADDVAEREDSKSEATVSATTSSNLVKTKGKSHTSSALILTNASANKTANEVSKTLSPEKKNNLKDKKSEILLSSKSSKGDEIGAVISFELDIKDKNKEKNSLTPKVTDTPSVPSQKRLKDKGAVSSIESAAKPPHDPENLLKSAASLVDSGKPPSSATCPKPEPIDSISQDHCDALSRTVIRDLGVAQSTGDNIGGEDAEPTERESQPLSKSIGQDKHGNYGSLGSSVSAGLVISSPEDDILPNASSTNLAQDKDSLAAGAEAPDEPTKKKKKRKKKKKAGTSETDGGGAASLSDHENKVLTSPGTSGTEDSSKPSISDSQQQPSSQKENGQTPLNGPSATQQKPLASNKSRKSEGKMDSGSKKQNNIKSADPTGDDSKPAMKPDKVATKSSSKADRPKSLDFSNKIDALRTTSQPLKANDKSKVGADNPTNKKDNELDNESDCGNDAEKSSEDTSVKASQESSVDETFQDDDESNGDGWQMCGQKKNKRRALAAEDTGKYGYRPSPADNFRRNYYSGPFDPRLRKSSSEPSGMSKWNDVSDSKPVYRHSSFSRQNQYLREEFHSLSRKPENVPASENVEKPPVPEPANSYAAKLKAKPPVAPIKKSQESASIVIDGQDIGIKVEDASKPVTPDLPSHAKGDPKDSPDALSESDSRSEAKSTTSSVSITESRGKLESDSEFLDGSGKRPASGVISASTVAKSASLPRDMGRKQGAELAKMDNTSADNVVQYLDLQCSNDTYAARLKQSINKAAEAKANSRIPSNKQEKLVPDESAKPPRTNKLEISHKAVSLDSAHPIPAVVPKKASSANINKDNKESMRTVKSETNLNLTSEGSQAVQDNSFPFPAATFDITFGSVKFSESEFELIDDVTHGNQQPKGGPDAKPVPQPTESQDTLRPEGAKSPSPPANHVSCADLEKEWISKAPESATAQSDNCDTTKEKMARAPSMSPVPPELAAIFAAEETNNKPLAKMGENNNMRKKSTEPAFQSPFWSSKFNHSELADMLQKDWESSHCELTKQSSNVIIYEEE